MGSSPQVFVTSGGGTCDRRWEGNFTKFVIFKSNFCRSEQILECTKRKGGKPVQPLTSDSRIHRQPQSGKTSSLNLCWKEVKFEYLDQYWQYLNIFKSICIWWPSFDHFCGASFPFWWPFIFFFVAPEQLRNSLSTMLQTLTFNATDEFSFWFPRRFYIEGIRLAAEWFPWSQAGNDPIIHFPLCDQDVQITPLWPRWSEFSSLFSNKMAFWL